MGRLEAGPVAPMSKRRRLKAKRREDHHHKMSLTFVASVPFGIYKTGEEKTDKS